MRKKKKKKEKEMLRLFVRHQKLRVSIQNRDLNIIIKILI